MDVDRHRSDHVGIAIAGAVGALVLATANVAPHLLMSGVGVGVTDGALMATGLALTMRQRPAPTAAFCWGLMTSKALLISLAALGVALPTVVITALTGLILLTMAGTLARRSWMLAGGALAAAVLTVLGPVAWGVGVRAAWFTGLALWLAPAELVNPSLRSERP